MQNQKFIGANTRRLVLTGIYLRGLLAQEAVEKSSGIFHAREPGKVKTKMHSHFQELISSKAGDGVSGIRIPGDEFFQ